MTKVFDCRKSPSIDMDKYEFFTVEASFIHKRFGAWWHGSRAYSNIDDAAERVKHLVRRGRVSKIDVLGHYPVTETRNNCLVSYNLKKGRL